VACAGTYRLATGLELRIEVGAHGLTLYAGPQPPMALSPISETIFLAAAANATLAFDRRADGAIHTLSFQQFGDEITGERLACGRSAGDSG
jgi:hypothetical protein